jgi:hypothetical protein
MCLKIVEWLIVGICFSLYTFCLLQWNRSLILKIPFPAANTITESRSECTVTKADFLALGGCS